MSARKESASPREHRHQRVRKRVTGTPARPRLCVYRSLKHISAQIIDDVTHITQASATSQEKTIGKKSASKDVAVKVGELVAKRALEKKITKVVFDRGGFLYHGQVKALADAARSAGLEF